MAQITQAQFNLRVIEILNQTANELGRLRDGRGLSNLAGVKRMINIIENDVLETWPKSEQSEGVISDLIP